MLKTKGWTRSQRAIIVSTLLYSVVFVAMLIFRPGTTKFYHAFNNVYQIFPPLFAAICGLLYAWRAQNLSRTQRLGWASLGFAGGFFTAGQIIWTYYESVRGIEVPFPGWADVGYLGAYPFLIAGVMLLFGSSHIAGRARVLLDSMITAGGLGAISWYFLVQRLWHKSDTALLGKVISISYPLGDVAVLFGALMLFSSTSANKRLRHSSALLAAGMILIAFFDTTFTFYTLNNTYHTGMWTDWSLSFGWLFVGYASLLRLWTKEAEENALKEEQTAPASGRRTLMGVLAPYIAAFSAQAIITLDDYANDHTISSTTSLIGYVLILLVICRQVLTLLENRHLTDNLERMVTMRTDQLKNLHNLTKAVNNTLQTDQVLTMAASHIQQVLNADAVAIWLLERNAEGEMTQPRLQMHMGLEKHPRTFRFITELPFHDTVETLFLPAEQADAPSSAGVFLRGSLRWQQQPMGMVGVIRWGKTFSVTDQELLESIGIEIGTALQHAQLYGAALEAADRDPVTGLYNHRAIHQRLDRQIKSANQHKQPFTIVMMDLNNFKLFNDTYGHPIGDEVLKRVAEGLAQEFGEADLLARYGGDEFLAMMPHGTIEQAAAIAVSLRQRMLREGFRRAGEERVIPITLSFGIATFPEDGKNRHELLTTADSNLYAAKNSDEGIIKTTESHRANRELKTEAFFDVLDAMVTAVDNKDRYTRSHSEDVTDYALWIAEELGLSEETMRVIRIGGLLHDVGKIGIPDDILRKPGRLTPEEYEILKRHPRLGALIVGSIPGMESIVDAVRCHHERWDGGGYPDGTQGEETPMLGRILGVADAVSAMTTHRPYRKGLAWDVVVDEIKKHSGTQFDPVMARAFLQAAEKRGVFSASAQPKAA